MCIEEVTILKCLHPHSQIRELRIACWSLGPGKGQVLRTFGFLRIPPLPIGCTASLKEIFIYFDLEMMAKVQDKSVGDSEFRFILAVIGL